MDIYRAVPRGKFSEGDVIGRHDGRRLPSVVPYVVDNLWEFARPANLPSRRHVLYASATPQLALENAAAHAPDGYLACRMAFQVAPAMYQLPVTDARHHPDIKVLIQFINRKLGSWSGSPVTEKLAMAPLFLPGVTKEELASAMRENVPLRDIVEEACKLVSFWQADQASVAPDGELFFELVDGTTYTLHPA